MHAARKLALQVVDAFDRVAMGHDVDPVILEPRVRREREQRAVAGVDPDFQKPLLEPDRAPHVAAGGGEVVRRRAPGEALVQIDVENVALQAVAGLPDDRVEALKPLAKRVGEDFDERIAMDGIVGDFRRRHRLAGIILRPFMVVARRSHLRRGLSHNGADEHLRRRTGFRIARQV